MIGLEFGGADVEVDVALAVVHLGREEVAGKFADLLRPRRRPHLHLKLTFENKVSVKKAKILVVNGAKIYIFSGGA